MLCFSRRIYLYYIYNALEITLDSYGRFEVVGKYIPRKRTSGDGPKVPSQREMQKFIGGSMPGPFRHKNMPGYNHLVVEWSILAKISYRNTAQNGPPRVSFLPGPSERGWSIPKAFPGG